MGTVIDLVATIVAIVGLLAAVGYGGYLFMLQSVAGKRPGASHLAADARGRLPLAGGLVLVTLVGLLLTGGGVPLDRKSTRLNSSHSGESRMPSSA